VQAHGEVEVYIHLFFPLLCQTSGKADGKTARHDEINRCITTSSFSYQAKH
jgi:hypothetical protein